MAAEIMFEVHSEEALLELQCRLAISFLYALFNPLPIPPIETLVFILVDSSGNLMRIASNLTRLLLHVIEKAKIDKQVRLQCAFFTLPLGGEPTCLQHYE